MRILGLAGLGPGLPAVSWGTPASEEEEFVFARIKYLGGDWDADTRIESGAGGSEVNLLKRLTANTNIPTTPGEFFIRAGDPDLGLYPFLYATGHSHLSFLPDEMEALRSVLLNGSLFFAEDCYGNGSFTRDFRRIITEILPEYRLARIPMDHPLFRSPYRIERILGGDKRITDYMEGIEIGGRLAVLFTMNDLGCAWEGHRCSPGGERQREHAFRLGINILAYSLCG